MNLCADKVSSMFSRLYNLALLVAIIVVGALVPACAAGSPPAEPLDALMGGSKHIMFVSYMGRSHMMPYLEILRPLADRGHKVTIVTDHMAVKWLQPSFPAYNILLVPDQIIDPIYDRMPHIMEMMLKGKQTSSFVNIIEHITLPSYKDLAVFFKGLFAQQQPDLVLCDFMSDACSDMADTLGIKMGVTLSGLPPGVSEAPYVNGWTSSVLTATTADMTFRDRFYNRVILPIKTISAMRPSLVKLQQIKDDLGVRVASGPGPQRFSKTLKIINTFVGFEVARPIDPTVQLVGPIRSHVNSTMPQNIQDWIQQLPSSSSSSSEPKRVIYVAFGTHVDLPDRVLTSLMTALVTTLDQGLADGVIWAVSNIKCDKFPADLDSRVLLLPFAPQKAVLASRDVCLFISHAGAESSHEAMYEGKPLLVIPFFGDQPMNAAKMSEAGFAEFIPQADVTTSKVQALLAKMLNPTTDVHNPKARNAHTYVAAAKRQQALVRTLVKHNRDTAADMLLFFAEYGWDYLISADKFMPWYKATDADIYAVIALTVVALLLAVGYAIKAVVSVVSSTGSKQRSSSAADHDKSDVIKRSQRSDQSEIITAAEPDADVVIRDHSATDLYGCAATGCLRNQLGGNDSAMLYRGSNGKDTAAAAPLDRPVIELKAKAL